MEVLHTPELSYSDGTRWVDRALVSGTTYYSDAVETTHSSGYAALLVKTDASITINFEVSLDGTNWYAPVNTNGTDVSKICAALATNAYVIFTPQPTKYMRIKVLCNSNAATTFYYIHQERV